MILAERLLLDHIKNYEAEILKNSINRREANLDIHKSYYDITIMFLEDHIREHKEAIKELHK